MEIQGRHRAPFSNRVWAELEAAVESVKRASCTARYVCPMDGPWGAGLTSLSGDDQWLEAANPGPKPHQWGVHRGAPPHPGHDPDQMDRRGTFLVTSDTRPVPRITSEFILGMRAIEAFDDDCQPLDVTRATKAARDVALEEERLIYYGNRGARQPGLLTLNPRRLLLRQLLLADPNRAPEIDHGDLEPAFDDLSRAKFKAYMKAHRQRASKNAHERFRGQVYQPFTYIKSGGSIRMIAKHAARAIQALGARGFGGPFALVLYPAAYTRVSSTPVGQIILADLLRKLFTMGVHMAPAISPAPRKDFAKPRRGEIIGVIVTCNRAYSRLVVGQDWTVSYAGSSGAGTFHKFAISSSLRLDLIDPSSIQVLRQRK